MSRVVAGSLLTGKNLPLFFFVSYFQRAKTKQAGQSNLTELITLGDLLSPAVAAVARAAPPRWRPQPRRGTHVPGVDHGRGADMDKKHLMDVTTLSFPPSLAAVAPVTGVVLADHLQTVCHPVTPTLSWAAAVAHDGVWADHAWAVSRRQRRQRRHVTARPLWLLAPPRLSRRLFDVLTDQVECRRYLRGRRRRRLIARRRAAVQRRCAAG